MQAAEEQLQLNLKIAKARAREMEEEGNLKLPEGDGESWNSFLPLPPLVVPASKIDGSHESPQPFSEAPLGVTPIGVTGAVKTERETNSTLPLNPKAPEFHMPFLPK